MKTNTALFQWYSPSRRVRPSWVKKCLSTWSTTTRPHNITTRSSSVYPLYSTRPRLRPHRPPRPPTTTTCYSRSITLVVKTARTNSIRSSAIAGCLSNSSFNTKRPFCSQTIKWMVLVRRRVVSWERRRLWMEVKVWTGPASCLSSHRRVSHPESVRESRVDSVATDKLPPDESARTRPRIVWIWSRVASTRCRLVSKNSQLVTRVLDLINTFLWPKYWPL